MAGVPQTTNLDPFRDFKALRQARSGVLSRAGGAFDIETVNEFNRLKQAESVAKGNVTRRRKLESLGVDVNPLLAPTEPKTEEEEQSFLGNVFDTLDVALGDRFFRKNVSGKLAELVTGRDLPEKDDIRGEDIVKLLRGKAAAEEGDFTDIGLGFLGELAVPSTFLTGGFGAGVKIFKGGKLAQVLKKGSQAAKTFNISKADEFAKLKAIRKTGIQDRTDEIFRGLVANTTPVGPGQLPGRTKELHKLAAGQARKEGRLGLHGQKSNELLRKEAEGIASDLFLKLDNVPTKDIDLGGLKFAGKTLLSSERFGSLFNSVRAIPGANRIGALMDPVVDGVKKLLVPSGGPQQLQNVRRRNGIIEQSNELRKQEGAEIMVNEGLGDQFSGLMSTMAQENLRITGLVPAGEQASIKFLNNKKNFKAIEKNIGTFYKSVGAEGIDPVSVRKAMTTTVTNMARRLKDVKAAGVEADFKTLYNAHIWNGLNKKSALTTGQQEIRTLQDGLEFASSIGLDIKVLSQGENIAKLLKKNPASQKVFDELGIQQQTLTFAEKVLGIDKSVEFDMGHLYAAAMNSMDTAIANRELADKAIQLGAVELKAAQKGISAFNGSGRRILGDEELGAVQRALNLGPEETTKMSTLIQKNPDDTMEELLVRIKRSGPIEGEAKNMTATALDDRGLTLFDWGGRKFVANQDLAKSFTDLAARNLPDDEINQIWRFWRKANQHFKKFVTVPFPAFHVRNFYGDLQRSMQQNILASANPENHRQAIMMLARKKGSITTVDGVEMSFDDVMDEFMKNGMYSFGIRQIDDAGDAVVNYQKKLRKNNGDPFSTFMDWLNPVKKGIKAGAFVENYNKLIMFTDGIKSGLSSEQSAERAFKFLFDYSSGTKFDSVMRDIVPFWTFFRKNMEFQARRFIEAPGQQVTLLRGLETLERAVPRALGQREFTEEERQALPEFVKENLAIPIYLQDNIATYFTNIDLPIQELNEVFSSNNSMRSLEKFAGRTSPLIKLLAEPLADKDFFFGGPLFNEIIEKETGRRRIPFNRRRDLPEFLDIFKGVESKVRGGERTTELDPIFQRLAAVAGGSRIISELGKSNRIKKAIESGSKERIIATLLDFLGGFKVREEDLQAAQTRQLTGRVFGQSEVLSRAQRENRP